MVGIYLLDTNIIIALLADEAIVKNNLAQANEVFIPSIAIGESCYSARKSGRTVANLAIASVYAQNSIETTRIIA